MSGKTATFPAAASVGLLWLRVLAGAGIASHGWQKIIGGRMELFTAGVAQMGFPLPEVFAWAAALSELAGGGLLILGVGTRFAALAIVLTMSVAAFIRHASDPFKVKELALCYWTMAGALTLMGGGRLSGDAWLLRRRTRSHRHKTAGD